MVGGARARKFALCGMVNLRNVDVGRVLTSGQWWWKRNGEPDCVLLTYAGGGSIGALAISGPRHGDLRGEGKNLHRTCGK